MAKITTSLIATVFNEENTILDLLKSIESQTQMPDEVIICDGGSTDSTLSLMTNDKYQISNKTKYIVLQKKGNRSVGRNEATRHAKGDIILCTDAGCTLDKNWVKKIVQPIQKDKTIDIVAGYYDAQPKTIFEKCIVPYVLVMPDKVDPHHFLPASRSMAFKKSVWQKIGGFDEKYSHNEDYVFAKKLEKEHYTMVFARNAIVYWQPRSDLKSAFVMFFRFAYGDAEAHIFRPKVLFLFLRYILGICLFIITFLLNSPVLLITCYLLLISYLLWSVLKNYKYIHHPLAIIFLPIIQITADFAVLLGTITGYLRNNR